MKFELDTLLENEIIDSNKIVKLICNRTPVWKGYTDDLSNLSENYKFVRFVKDIPNEFNKPDYIIEVAELDGEEEPVDTTPRSPEVYLDTKEQVERVARNFSKINPDHRDIVAKRLLTQGQKLGVTFGDDVDPEFIKYVQEASVESKKIEENLIFELTGGYVLTEDFRLSEKKNRRKIIKNCDEKRNGFYVRPYLKTDKDEFEALLASLSKTDRKLLAIDKKMSVIRDCMRNERHIYLAINDGKIVGFFRESGRSNHTFMLEEFAVFPQYRGRGFSKLMMQYYTEFFEKSSAKTLSSNVIMNHILPKFSFVPVYGKETINWTRA